MPDAVTPPDPGLLSSIADEISLPGFALRNLLRGDIGAAGRNVADFGLNLIDAPIPGDWIPEISAQEDRPEFRDVVQAYGGELPEGLLGSAVNLAGDIATDPLTFIPGAQVAKGFGLATKGASKLVPQAAKEAIAPTLQKAGKTLRRTFGVEKIGKPLQDVITRAQGAKDTAGAAAQATIAEGLKGASKRELEAAGEVLTNVQKDATGVLSAVDETDALSMQDRLQKYLLSHPDVDADKLQRIIQTSQGVGKAEWESGQAGNIFTDVGKQPISDVVMGAIPGTTAREGIENYFPRIFEREAPEDLADLAASPSAIKLRKLETTKDVLAHLAAHPNDKLLINAAEVLSRRAASQAELASRGATGKGLFEMAREAGTEIPEEVLAKALPFSGGTDVNAMLAGTARAPAAAEKIAGTSGDVVMGGAKAEPIAKSGLSESQRKQARDWLLSQDYKHADPLLKEAATAIAKNLPGDEADVALNMLQGMKPRQGLAKMLASVNRPFKSVAVYGAIVPKIGSITRNLVSGLFQKYANPEARGTISPANIPSFMRDWLASIDDGVEKLFGKRLLTKNEFQQVDDAYKLSGGDPRKALGAIKDPIMRGAVERGIFGNNFVDSEQLIAAASQGKLRDFGGRLWSYPGAMFRGAEQRMRYGLYKSLVKSGKSQDDAARITRDSFFDYSQTSAENRLARDYLPFAQYLFKSIPQSAKLMAEKPWLASLIANVYTQGRDEPVLSHMEGKLNLPLGTDEQGNRQYLSGLGLPFESLSAIPNPSASPLQFGRDIEQNIVGASNPLLKLAYSYTAGRDPTFGSLPGSYTKFAGQDLGKVGSVLNQLLGTGTGPTTALQGIGSTAGKLLDERTSIPEAAANLLTGARIQSVDPERAIQQRIQAMLERSPDIGQFRSFYSEDPDAQEILQRLADAKKSLKEKKKAQASVN